MSEQTQKVAKTSTKGKWTELQARGFQFLVLALVMFWTGWYLGGMSVFNHNNDIQNAKASAIEETASKE